MAEPRVLLLDDDRAWMRGMSRVLQQRMNAVCRQYEKVEAAFAGVVAEPPDICVVDYHLADGRTGAEFASTIHEELGPKGPSLLLVSAAMDEIESHERLLFDRTRSKIDGADAIVEVLVEMIRFQAYGSGSNVRRRPIISAHRDSETG